MKKRIGAVVLCFFMALSLLPVGALAGEPSTTQTDSSVAQVGDNYYDSLQGAIDAASPDSTVSLLKDVTGDRISVTKNLTIDGANNTLTDTNTDGRAIWIDATNVTLTLKNLTIDGDNKCQRGVQVNQLNGVWNNAKIVIDNCTVKNITHYAINLCSNTTVDLTVKDSTIQGWAAINAYGTGNTILVEKSTLEGRNDKGKDSWNNFATICLEGDTTLATDAHSADYNVTIKDSTVKASQTTGNIQTILGFNTNAQHSTVSFDNVNFDIGEGCHLGYDIGSTTNPNALLIDNKTVSMPHGYYFDLPVAEIENIQYLSLEEAITAAENDDTIILLQNVNITDNLSLSDGTYIDGKNKTVTVNSGTLTITGGNYKDVIFATENPGQIEISGGYFSIEPNASYLASGKTAIANTGDNKDEYPWVVTDKAPNAAEIAESTAEVASTLSSEQANTVTNALSTGTPTVESETLDAQVSTIANNNAVTAKQAKEKLNENKIELNSSDTTKIVIQPFVYIELTDVQAGEDSAITSFTLDIEMKYNVIATKSDTSTENLKTDGNNQNAVILDTKSLTVDKPVTMQIPLPSGFATAEGAKVYIQHTKNGITYSYTGEIKTGDNSTRYVEFTNPHGFSQFVFTTDPPVASIGDTDFATITDAVNAAVKGDTIVLNRYINTTEPVTVNKAITIVLPLRLGEGDDTTTGNAALNYTGENIKAANGFNKEGPKEGSNEGSRILEFTAKPSGAGGGGGGVAQFGVAIADTSNGTVKTDKTSAAKDAKVTLTVKPDEGYKLDKLTVKDSSDQTVTAKDNGDGTWTFTMPAAKVTVTATFVKDETQPTPTPSDNEKFVDVPKDAYYHDAVYWAVDKGITEGVDATHFAPDATCTRAQMVTFLWRAAGQPAPASSENPFTDVKEGAYYYDAVLWAVEKGITVGTSSSTFSPDDTVIRGQAVTFLWRCEGQPAPGSSENPFSDVTSSDYFYQPILWAVEKNVTAGTSKTTFSPQANCLRSQVVTFLNRAAGQE